MRLEEANGWIKDLKNENSQLSAELLKTSKQSEDLERAVQDSANWHIRINLQPMGVKERLMIGSPRPIIMRSQMFLERERMMAGVREKYKNKKEMVGGFLRRDRGFGQQKEETKVCRKLHN